MHFHKNLEHLADVPASRFLYLNDAVLFSRPANYRRTGLCTARGTPQHLEVAVPQLVPDGAVVGQHGPGRGAPAGPLPILPPRAGIESPTACRHERMPGPVDAPDDSWLPFLWQAWSWPSGQLSNDAQGRWAACAPVGATMCCAFPAVTQQTMLIGKRHHAGAIAVCLDQEEWPPFELSTGWGCELHIGDDADSDEDDHVSIDISLCLCIWLPFQRCIATNHLHVGSLEGSDVKCLLTVQI